MRGAKMLLIAVGMLGLFGITGSISTPALGKKQGSGYGSADYACFCWREPDTRGRFEIRGEVGGLANHTCQEFCWLAIRGE